MKYLKGHIEQEITYYNNGKTNLLEAYYDSDYAGDLETRRSTKDTLYFMPEVP